jgi:hypothetical protein
MKKLLTLTMALAGFWLASSSAEAYPGTALIRCDSINRSTTRCSTNEFIQSARIVAQHSNTECVYGRTWGYDSNSVWVSRGCRATFEVYYNNAPLPPPHHPPLPPPGPISCGRYNTFLNVAPRAQAWVSLGCPVGCRLSNYGYFGSNMPCNWNVNYTAATLTCFNSNPYAWEQVPQVFIDCVR